MVANALHRRAPIEQPGKATSPSAVAHPPRLVPISVRGERLAVCLVIVHIYVLQALALIGLVGSILWIVEAD